MLWRLATRKLVQPTSDPACCHDNIHRYNVNLTINITYVLTMVWFVSLALVECRGAARAEWMHVPHAWHTLTATVVSSHTQDHIISNQPIRRVVGGVVRSGGQNNG